MLAWGPSALQFLRRADSYSALEMTLIKLELDTMV
jgi:hypothetical protein